MDVAVRGWLGPRDCWPEHPSINRALAEALASGWWLEPCTGTIWGRITCTEPLSDRGLGQTNCLLLILQAPAGNPQEHAKRILRGLRACPHGEPISQRDASLPVNLHDTGRLLADAEQLLTRHVTVLPAVGRLEDPRLDREAVAGADAVIDLSDRRAVAARVLLTEVEERLSVADLAGRRAEDVEESSVAEAAHLRARLQDLQRRLHRAGS
jgi:hypothetical protein